jgi:hypothetical protein
MIPIVDQRPMCRALIAQPKMFHLTLPLPGSDKWRSGRLTRFGKAIRFYQEELAFPQPQKRFVTSFIGAMAKHRNNCFLLFESRPKSDRIHIS